jgi:hypothetical protein
MVSDHQPCQLILRYGKSHGHRRPLHGWNSSVGDGHRMLRSIYRFDRSLGISDWSLFGFLLHLHALHGMARPGVRHGIIHADAVQTSRKFQALRIMSAWKIGFRLVSKSLLNPAW